MTGLVRFALAFFQSDASQGSSLTGLLYRASPVAKAVLILLVIFSIASWAIIFAKLAWLRRAERVTKEFTQGFKERQKLSDMLVDSEHCRQSPVARIFLAAYDEIANQMNRGGSGVHSLDSVQRVLQSATIEEVTQMERSLGWLATTANASPFIGLFGTVVGIIIAFQGLSGATTSSIQAVAPGIAEALIATAAGIAAAVPAAIFYNNLLGRVKNLTAAMDKFTLELLNFVERNYVKADV